MKIPLMRESSWAVLRIRNGAQKTPEDDPPTVEVVIGAELRQPQSPTAGELLEGGTAGRR